MIDIAYIPVANSSVEVSQTQALLETEVIQGLTDQQGQLRLSLQQPGSYLVQVVLSLISIYHGSSPSGETLGNTLPGGSGWVLWRAEAAGGRLFSPLLHSLLSKALHPTP